MRKLYIVRHGETEYNVENRYAGTIDIELNDKGKEQSRKIAKELINLPIDVIVSSSKKRALQTATIINNYLNKPLFKKEVLVERSIGLFEGYTRREVADKYPELWKKNVLHDRYSLEHGGESVDQVYKRAKMALDEVFSEHPNGNILMVTHGYISRMMNTILKNISEKKMNDFLLSNCQMAEYDID